MRPVPVLMYHHISPHKGDMVTVTPGVFEGQMRHLMHAGYRTLKIDEMMELIEDKKPISEKAIIVTFDDGWLDNYIFAFPILKKYGITATIFIVTDWVEKASLTESQQTISVPKHAEAKRLATGSEAYKAMLNWKLIGEMAGSGLVEFYSHTKTHPRCDQLVEADLAVELGRSKRIIEEKLGKPCSYLCWPKGKYAESGVRVAKGIGYKAIFTTVPGVVTTDSDPFAVGRIVVKDGVGWFKKRLSIYTSPMFSRLYLRMKKR